MQLGDLEQIMTTGADLERFLAVRPVARSQDRVAECIPHEILRGSWWSDPYERLKIAKKTAEHPQGLKIANKRVRHPLKIAKTTGHHRATPDCSRSHDTGVVGSAYAADLSEL